MITEGLRQNEALGKVTAFVASPSLRFTLIRIAIGAEKQIFTLTFLPQPRQACLEVLPFLQSDRQEHNYDKLCFAGLLQEDEGCSWALGSCLGCLGPPGHPPGPKLLLRLP